VRRLTPLAWPFLAPRLSTAKMQQSFVVADDEVSLQFTGDAVELLEKVCPHIDGQQSLQALAEVAGVSVDRIAAVLDTIAEEYLLIDAAGIINAEAADFQEVYWDECEFWAKEIVAQPFWRTLRAGGAPRAVVLGWGVEFCHFVEAANEHMALSVASCRADKQTQMWFAQHYLEEADHARIFLEGLMRCGLDGEAICIAPPLASTAALIGYLDELATSDCVAYAATFGVMQQSRHKRSKTAVDSIYDTFTELYPFAGGMFDAFRRHAMIDADLSHEKLVLERMASREGGLSPDERHRVARAVRDVTEHFILFFEGIGDYYNVPNAPLPRRALDVRTFL